MCMCSALSMLSVCICVVSSGCVAVFMCAVAIWWAACSVFAFACCLVVSFVFCSCVLM